MGFTEQKMATYALVFYQTTAGNSCHSFIEPQIETCA
jgi:hypothetical protein